MQKTAQDVAEMLSGVDYLESNFRTVLARLLRSQKLEVFEEVVIPYVNATNQIPFGHGFVDIVILTPKRRHPVRVEDDKEGLHKAVAEIYEKLAVHAGGGGAQQLILMVMKQKLHLSRFTPFFRFFSPEMLPSNIPAPTITRVRPT